MRVLIIPLLILLYTSTAMAVVTELNVSNLSSNVFIKSGPFNSKSISFVNDGKRFEYPSLVGTVEVSSDTFLIRWLTGNLKVHHNFAEQVSKLRKFQFDKLFVDLVPGKTDVAFENFYLDTNQNELTSITNFFIRCYNPNPTIQITTMLVLETCANVGSIHLDRLELKQNKRMIYWNQKLSALTFFDEQDDKISYVDLRSTDMNITNGAYTITGVVKSFMNSKLRIEGDMYLDKPANILVLKIAKAKVGIVDIKNTMLKSIADTKLSRITVDGDRVIIFLGILPSLEAFQNL